MSQSEENVFLQQKCLLWAFIHYSTRAIASDLKLTKTCFYKKNVYFRNSSSNLHERLLVPVDQEFASSKNKKTPTTPAAENKQRDHVSREFSR